MRTISRILYFIFGIFLVLPLKTALSVGNFADINLIYPENQNPNVSSYYDIVVEPGQNIFLSFTVSNSSDKEQRFTVKPANAFTSSNASDISLSSNKSFSSSKIISDDNYVSEWINTPTSFTLKPYQSKNVSVEVTIPNNASGQYLGGFLVTNAPNTSEKSPNNSSITLKQKFERGISILLNVGKTPKDNLTVNEANFKIENNKNIIELKISNPTNKISQLHSTTLIMKQDNKIIGKFNINRLKFSPQTSILYSYDISKYDFKYDDNITLELQGYYDENKSTPIESQIVNLDNKQLEEDAKKENFLDKNFFNQETKEIDYTIYFIFLIPIIFITLFFFIKRKKNDKDKNSNSK